jgi:hypothetical protein
MVFGSAKLSLKTGYRAGHLLGYRRMMTFATGIAVGLLVAPVPGRELRRELRRRWEARGVTDETLLERVKFELAHHPRTWHLTQPEVIVAGRKVTLRGELTDDQAREDMVRTVGAIPGVAGVDCLLGVNVTPLRTREV